MKLITPAVLGLLVTVLTACGGECMTSQMTVVKGDIAAMLKEVKDAESAETALPELELLVERLRDLQREADADPDKAARGIDRDSIEASAEASQALMLEGFRLNAVEYGAKVTDVLSTLRE